MAEQTGKKLSHQAKGSLLLFAAIPVNVASKYSCDDHSRLGVVASLLLASESMEPSKKVS